MLGGVAGKTSEPTLMKTTERCPYTDAQWDLGEECPERAGDGLIPPSRIAYPDRKCHA